MQCFVVCTTDLWNCSPSSSCPTFPKSWHTGQSMFLSLFRVRRSCDTHLTTGRISEVGLFTWTINLSCTEGEKTADCLIAAFLEDFGLKGNKEQVKHSRLSLSNVFWDHVTASCKVWALWLRHIDFIDGMAVGILLPFLFSHWHEGLTGAGENWGLDVNGAADQRPDVWISFLDLVHAQCDDSTLQLQENKDTENIFLRNLTEREAILPAVASDLKN